MNSQSAVTVNQVADEPMKSRGGYFVAWSRATPGHGFGEWSLISINQELNSAGKLVNVTTFVKALSGAEIAHLKNQPYLWWGVNLRDEPWSLVFCRPSYLVATRVIYDDSRNHPIDPLRSTGV